VDGRSAIGWQAAAPVYQEMAIGPPRDFRVRKTLRIIGLKEKSVSETCLTMKELINN